MSRGEQFVDYYELLGVQPGALPAEIRVAFMRLAKHQHPDAGGSLETMQVLNKAYATLKDPRSRRVYDRLHSFHTGTSTVQYHDDFDDAGAAASMSDDEMDDFLDTIFAEYATPPAKVPLHKKAKNKAKNVIRFRRK